MMDKVKEDLVPALLSSAISIGAYSLVFGESPMDSVPFFSTQLPGGIVVGGTVFGSHLVGNILQEHVLNMVQSKGIANIEGSLLKPIISGASTALIFKLGVSSDSDLIKSFGIGAGSVITGQYISNTFLKKN